MKNKICPIVAKLSTEEIIALAQYANANGKQWKSKLRSAWMVASLSGPIHQLRNVAYFGPLGLIKINSAALQARFQELILANAKPVECVEMEKKAALAKFLGEEIEDICESSYSDDVFESGRMEYLVLTDSEADEKAAESIKDSVWAFRPEFLANYTDLPEEVFTAMQAKCEDANDPILRIIKGTDGGIQGFIDEAISADGRGHFLASYDHDEGEAGEFFIYRIN